MVKAYMKTIEILLVIVLTTMLLLIIIPRPSTLETEQKNYLIHLEQNAAFRNFAIQNAGCYNSTDTEAITGLVRGYLPQDYSFVICIDQSAVLPDKETIYANSIIISGNYSSIDVKTVRLFYWP